LVDLTLSWVLLAYGLFAAAVESVWDRDEMQIALGAESVLLALVGFLWAGERRALGWALITSGIAAPLVLYGSARLYWDDVDFFASDVILPAIALGGAIGVPLIAIGVFTLRRARSAPPRPDPWWFRPLRWAIQGGLLIVILAFRQGSWDGGIPLVYLGGALALTSLLVALPRRFAVTRRGVGTLLLVLGLAALLVIGVAAGLVGSHMSGDEAAVGLVPAALVAAIGAVLIRSGPSRRSATAPAQPGRGDDHHVDPGAVEGAFMDTLHNTPNAN
jgi:hypothetical protein